MRKKNTLCLIFLLITLSGRNFAQTTYYTRGSGNWSNTNTWTTSCGGAAAASIPGAGDDVVITCNNTNRTVTVDGTYTCRNLTIGTADADAIVQITNAANSLTITGDLQINSTNQAGNTYRLDAGPGTVNINGTFSYWGTANSTHSIRVNTGTVNITPAINIADNDQEVRFNGAGTINFNNDFTDSQNNLVTAAGCTVNFDRNYTVNTNAATWNNTSLAYFSGNGFNITATTAITFGNIQFDASGSMSLVGNISVTRNWTNDGGTFNAGTSTVTFSGTGITQTITKSGGTETFYTLTANQATSTIQLGSNIIISNTLNMNGHNFNLNGDTLQLGNGASATLSRTAGVAYGGIFKRWFPASAPFYGLFPVGTSTQYRPVEINTTVAPATAGYVMVTHTDALTITDVAYVDNTGDAIQRITDMKSTISTSVLAGGTYSLDVTMTNLTTTGVLADLKLETIAGLPPGVGANAATAGTVASPIVKRTGLTLSELNNDFVVGTKDKTASPLRLFYYSRVALGNWNVNASWSTTGCGGAAATSFPNSSAVDAIICSGNQINLNSNVACGTLYMEGGTVGTASNNRTLNVSSDLIFNSGTIDITQGNTDINIGNNLEFFNGNITGTSTGDITINNQLNVQNTGTAIIGRSTITVLSSTNIDGTLQFSISANGNKSFRDINISSTGTWNNTTGEDPRINGNIVNNGNWLGPTGGTADYQFGRDVGGTYTISGNPVVFSRLSIYNASTVTNMGTIIIDGNVDPGMRKSGGGGNVTFNNGDGITNVVLYLQSTGGVNGVVQPGNSLIFNASFDNNTVYYSRPGNQNIRIPDDNCYYDLVATSSGTKTVQTGTTGIKNSLIIREDAIVNVGTNTLSDGCGGTASLTMLDNAELQIAKCNPTAVPELTGTYTLTGGTITLNGNCNQTYNSTPSGASDVYNITLGNSNAKTITGITTINGNVTVSGSATIAVHSAFTMDCSKSFTYNSTGNTTLSSDISIGDFAHTNTGDVIDGSVTITVCGSSWNRTTATNDFVPTGRVIFNPSSGVCSVTSSAAANITRFRNVTINIGKTLTGDVNGMNIGNTGGADWTNNGTFTHNSGTVISVGNITIQGSAITTFNNLTISSGILTGHATNMNIEGTWTNNVASGFNHNNSLVTFTGGNAQNLAGSQTTTFYNLTINKTAGTTLTQTTGTVTVDNLLTMTEGIFNVGANTLNGAGGFTATGGDLQIAKATATAQPELSGNYNITGGTVTLNRGGAQTLNTAPTGADTYYNLVFTNSGAKTITGLLTINGDVTVSGSATIANTNSSFVQAAGKTFYYNSSAGTSTLAAATDVTIGSYSQTVAGGTFDINGNNLTVTGSSWNKTNGTFSQTGRVIFKGSTTQSFTHNANTFANVTIDNVNGVTLNNSIIIFTNLNFIIGNIVTGNYIVRVSTPSGAGVTRTSGHVEGMLQKLFPIGVNISRTFEVGTGTDYSPVNITFANVTGSNYLGCSSIGSEHYDIYGANIEPLKSVNRYWTLTNSGVTFTTYDATFNFVASDVDPTADWNNFGVKRYNGTEWFSTTTGTRTATSTQITGMTSLDREFCIGEVIQTTNIYTRVTGAALWSNPSTWIQYKTGAASFTNASAVVTGAGTLFCGVDATCGNADDELKVGDVLMLQGTPGTVRGTVQTLTNNTTLTLTAPATATIAGGYGRQAVPSSYEQIVFIGNTNIATAAVNVTLDIDTIINTLEFLDMAYSNSLTHNTGKRLTINSAVYIKQPNTDSRTNSWNINDGSAILKSNLRIASNDATSATRVAQVNLTTGTLTIGNNLIFNSQSTSTATAMLAMTGAANVNLAGALVLQNNTGNLSSGVAGGTVNYNGTSIGGQTITTGSAIIYYNLKTGNTSTDGVRLGAGLTAGTTGSVRNNFVVDSGLFYTNGFSITLSGANAGTFQVGNPTGPDATFRMTGASVFPTGFTTYTFDPTYSHTQYRQSNAQNISVRSYGYLYIQPTSDGISHTFQTGTTSVAKNLTLGNGTNTITANTTAAAVVINVTDSISIAPNTTYNISNATSANTMSVGGNWINNGGTFTPGTRNITFNGTNNQIINGTVLSQTFYNITITKSAGTTLFTGGSTTTLNTNNITLNSGNFIAPATLNLNSTATSSLTLNGDTFTAGANITIRGSWTNNGGTFIPNGGLVQFVQGTNPQNINGTATEQTFYDIEINKSAGVVTIGGSTTTLNITNNYTQTAFGLNASAATTVNIGNDFTISSGTFNNGSNIQNLNIGGDILFNGGTWTMSNNVTLNGTTTQTMGGSSTIPQFTNFRINNTDDLTGAAVTLNKPITVDGVFTLTDGHLATTATNILTLTDNATVTLNAPVTQDSSFVKGPMSYQEDDNGAAATKIFPVGRNNEMHRIDMNITHSSAGTNTYSAKYYISTDAEFIATSSWTLPSTLDRVSGVGHWNLTKSGTATITSTSVKLYYLASDYVTNATKLRIAKGNPSAWTYLGGTGSGVPSGNITSNIFTTFSDITLADTVGGGNPLPIDLLSFTAKVRNQDIVLEWITATEINNDFFTVEKTNDGEHFETVDIVDAAGNSSSMQTYHATDENPFMGVSYYRLKQTDYDGRFSYSDFVAVEFIDKALRKEIDFTVFPNPSDGLNINIKSNKDYYPKKRMLVVVADLLGNQYHSEIIITSETGSYYTAIDPFQKIPCGVYVVIGSSNSDMYSEILIIE